MEVVLDLQHGSIVMIVNGSVIHERARGCFSFIAVFGFPGYRLRLICSYSRKRHQLNAPALFVKELRRSLSRSVCNRAAWALRGCATFNLRGLFLEGVARARFRAR